MVCLPQVRPRKARTSFGTNGGWLSLSMHRLKDKLLEIGKKIIYTGGYYVENLEINSCFRRDGPCFAYPGLPTSHKAT